MLISDCCGAPEYGNSSDMGICTDCKEHCEYIDENDERYDDIVEQTKENQTFDSLLSELRLCWTLDDFKNLKRKYEKR